MYTVITYWDEGSPQVFFCKTADEMAKVMHDRKDSEHISVYKTYGESGVVQLIAGSDIRGEMK